MDNLTEVYITYSSFGFYIMSDVSFREQALFRPHLA